MLIQTEYAIPVYAPHSRRRALVLSHISMFPVATELHPNWSMLVLHNLVAGQEVVGDVQHWGIAGGGSNSGGTAYLRHSHPCSWCNEDGQEVGKRLVFGWCGTRSIIASSMVPSPSCQSFCCTSRS